MGPQAVGLSPASIGRLKEAWRTDFKAFQIRDLSNKRYVYFWVDGVYLEARLEERQCMLIVIGADETGKKELVALRGGFRESELSWQDLLLDSKSRGLVCSPELCIGVEPWDFGRHFLKSIALLNASVVGFIKARMFLISYRKVYNSKLKRTCKRFG